jgi:hypothetical protein
MWCINREKKFSDEKGAFETQGCLSSTVCNANKKGMP